MADPSYIGADGVLTDGEAWVGLATTTLGADAASVRFTNPNDGSSTDWSQFMDLIIVGYTRILRAVAGGDWLVIELNDDAFGNGYYNGQAFVGDGANASGQGDMDQGYLAWMPSASDTTGIFGAFVTTLFDINSGKNKMFSTTSCDDSAPGTNGQARLMTVNWMKQADLAAIDLIGYRGDLADGSMFSLFGVLPRMGPPSVTVSP
jgi:hypothetical protein